MKPNIILAKPRRYSQSEMNRVASKGIIANIFVYGSGKMRYFGKTSDVFDAKSGGECQKDMNHAVNSLTSSGNVVDIMNSWGVDWGLQGTKRIRACGENNLYGEQGRIAHPYGFY